MAADLKNKPQAPRDGFFTQFVGVLTDAANLVDHYNMLPKSAYELEVLETQKEFKGN